MKMFPDLSAFLYELYVDYSEHGKDVENCFCYRYLKKQKEEQAAEIGASKKKLLEYAGRQKLNKYILLHAAYLAFKNGRITADEYKKYYVELSQGRKKKAAQMQAATVASASDVAAENAELEKYLLKNLVSDFFNNAGFKSLSDNYSDAADNSAARGKYSKHSKSFEKNTDNINMLCEYLRYRNGDLSVETSSGFTELTEDFKEECAKRFESFNQNPRSSAFLPLYFDPVSGAGIFIVGKYMFEDKLQKVLTENCEVCIIRFMNAFDEIKNYMDYDAINLTMTVERCPDVRSAFKTLRTGVDSGAYLGEYLSAVSDEDAQSDGVTLKLLETSCPEIIAEYKNREKLEFERLDKQ